MRLQSLVFLPSSRRFKIHPFLLLLTAYFISSICFVHANTEQICLKPIDRDKQRDSDNNDNYSLSSSKVWKWNLDVVHRCNISRMTFSELYQKYPSGLPPLYHEPVILTNNSNNEKRTDNAKQDYNSKFASLTTQTNIVNSLPPDFNVTLSSSNSFSAHRRTIPLTDYIQETVLKETYPDDWSNETWYLFGETYGPEWKELLNHFVLPPCQTCTSDLSSLAFGIGGRGSGVQWHVHGPGFSETIHGRKHWVLYEPNSAPSYNPDHTSRHWMEEIYTTVTTITNKKTTEEKELLLPWECTIFPGEMIYFPDRWHHATINLDSYTVFVSTFTTEHF